MLVSFRLHSNHYLLFLLDCLFNKKEKRQRPLTKIKNPWVFGHENIPSSTELKQLLDDFKNQYPQGI